MDSCFCHVVCVITLLYELGEKLKMSIAEENTFLPERLGFVMSPTQCIVGPLFTHDQVDTRAHGDRSCFWVWVADLRRKSITFNFLITQTNSFCFYSQTSSLNPTVWCWLGTTVTRWLLHIPSVQHLFLKIGKAEHSVILLQHRIKYQVKLNI